jgi:class 3 adenylate cyclase
MTRKRLDEIEQYLKLQPGSFDHIPHYARDSAIESIRHVMRLERKQLFRPGLYYILLSDLCRSTIAAKHLGATLNKRRVESFVLKCIEALGQIDLENYAMFIREIGDAVLILFSSFNDILQWHMTMQDFINKQNELWRAELQPNQYKYFKTEAKTVVHAGEVIYSDVSRPIALSVNQVFKMEKLFGPNELGVSHIALNPILPILQSTIFTFRKHKEILLPGDRIPMKTFKIVLKPRHRPTCTFSGSQKTAPAEELR